MADYFAMLEAEREGRVYVKSRHREALMDRIGRTNRSVEFKHMNISAVLSELHLPTIKGYKPKFNYQNAIFDAIERYVDRHEEQVFPDVPVVAAPALVFADAPELFVEAPPTPNFNAPPKPERLQRLARKYDFVERDFRNRKLGFAGEQRIFDFEQERLRREDRPDLARKVRWVSQEDGDGAGYDIHSFDAGGRERLIEVKTTCGIQTTPFFLTRNEESLAREREGEFRICRLYDFAKLPKMFELRPPLGEQVVLETETWRAGFG